MSSALAAATSCGHCCGSTIGAANVRLSLSSQLPCIAASHACTTLLSPPRLGMRTAFCFSVKSPAEELPDGTVAAAGTVRSCSEVPGNPSTCCPEPSAASAPGTAACCRSSSCMATHACLGGTSAIPNLGTGVPAWPVSACCGRSAVPRSSSCAAVPVTSPSLHSSAVSWLCFSLELFLMYASGVAAAGVGRSELYCGFSGMPATHACGLSCPAGPASALHGCCMARGTGASAASSSGAETLAC